MLSLTARKLMLTPNSLRVVFALLGYFFLFLLEAPAASFSLRYSQSRAKRYPYLDGSCGDCVSSQRTVLLLAL